MPETSSRHAQMGISRPLYANKASWLMIIATSLTLVLPTYGYTRRRSAKLHEIAGFHLRDCVSDYSRADRMKALGISPSNCNRVTRTADYHLSLVEKYSQAARYPWLPVAPDPPRPE